MPEACPKCGTAVNAARTHCATCGLAHERMPAFAKTRDDVAEPLTNAWQRALDAWDDRASHDEVLRLVSQHDAYAWAAAHFFLAAKTLRQDLLRAEGGTSAEAVSR